MGLMRLMTPGVGCRGADSALPTLAESDPRCGEAALLERWQLTVVWQALDATTGKWRANLQANLVETEHEVDALGDY